MKRIMMALYLGIAFLILGCRGEEKVVQPFDLIIVRPSDFAFIFEYSSCGPDLTYSLDTSKNILTYSPRDGKEPSEVEMQLTNYQLNLVFRNITDINFFNYPEIYIVPDEQIHGYQAPSGTHKLTVTNNSQTHSVTWTDEILTKEPYMDEINLRQLALLILNMIWSNPSYQNLPAGDACA